MRSRPLVFGFFGMFGLLAACTEAGPAGASDQPVEDATSDVVPGSAPSSGGAGGTAPAPPTPSSSECAVDADCSSLGAATFCSSPACEGGRCVRKVLQPAGAKLPSQRYGDCREARCAADGSIVDEIDNSDVFQLFSGCTEDVCTDGTYSSVNHVKGYLCNTGVCDGSGHCLTCIVDVDCAFKGAGYTCESGTCLGTSCKNGVKDPGEGDIDCGGACRKCAEGKNCSFGPQCASGVCSSGKCAAPSCSDGVKNGDEIYVDCGGPTCAACGFSAPCSKHSDCTSNVCVEGFCSEPSCTDAVKNGEETGIDCGGSCAPCAQ